MNSRIKFYLSAFILGLTSMIGQIIILRELIVVFYGNELSLSVILASWLFWVSLGSFFSGRLTDVIKSKEKVLSFIQIATAIILPLNIVLIRSIKSILKISTGEVIGIAPMLGSSFVSLALICLLLGITFTLLSKLSAEKNQNSPSGEIGKIYMLEALGASMGGLIYSFYLIKAFSPLQNALFIAGANIIASILFDRVIIQFIYIAIILSTLLLKWPGHVDRLLRGLQFRPLDLVETKDSIYGNISIVKIGKDFAFYENGLLIFTTGDLLSSEEQVHYAMLEHTSPKDVLLIGGGIGGSLKELLKHHVKSIDYVELDPLIIELSEKHTGPIKDNRVNIINIDGRLFVKQNIGKKTYDVIILNLPDPYTAMLNRFYSIEFFREAKALLDPSGVFSFSLSASENYINHENAVYLGCIYNTLNTQFQDIKTLPGDNIVFLASNAKDLLTYDYNVLIKRLKERRINTKFVREYYLPFKLNPLRIKYVHETIKESGKNKINMDFRPIGYFYHMLLWSSLFSGGKGFLPYIKIINIYLFLAILIALFILIFLIQRLLKKPNIKMPIMLSIATTGMSEISFQVIVILAFQFLYGYVYYKVGLILTSFMIGLVLGSLFINKFLGKMEPTRAKSCGRNTERPEHIGRECIRDEKSLYLKTQAIISIYPIMLPVIFLIVQKINLATPGISKNIESVFTFLPIIAGFIGGIQFPLANKICLEYSSNVGKTTGLLYGFDLFGSSVGGLLTGLIFIPILGIIQTCILLSILNLLILILISTSNHSR